jgi:hypothetical protein
MTTMRIAIVAAVTVLGMALAGPAHAQMRGPASGGMATTAVAGTGSGGGGGSASGGSYGGGGGLAAGRSSSSLQGIRYQNSAAHGTEADFELTAFVPYAEAVKMGERALAQQSKTLGQIAAEYRVQKRGRQ